MPSPICTLTSAQLPPILALPAPSLIANATTSGTGPEVEASMATAQRPWTNLWNANALRGDLSTQYAGPGCKIGWGFDLTTVSGLALLVSAGQANIRGIVETPAVSLSIPASQSRVWIYVLQNGTVTYVVGASSPMPQALAVLLGSVVTSSSAITQIEYAGRMLNKGIPWRQTADTGLPGDSPVTPLLFLTHTPAGDWLWNGTTYQPAGVDPTLSSPFVLPYGTTIARDASSGSVAKITATDTVAFAISAPTNAPGRTGRLVFKIANASGGSLGTITWNAIYKLTASWTSPANTFYRVIEFVYVDGSFVEVFRSGDI